MGSWNCADQDPKNFIVPNKKMWMALIKNCSIGGNLSLSKAALKNVLTKALQDKMLSWEKPKTTIGCTMWIETTVKAIQQHCTIINKARGRPTIPKWVSMAGICVDPNAAASCSDGRATAASVEPQKMEKKKMKMTKMEYEKEKQKKHRATKDGKKRTLMETASQKGKLGLHTRSCHRTMQVIGSYPLIMAKSRLCECIL